MVVGWEREKGGEVESKEGSRRNIFLMATRLVMKHTVHKPLTLEYGIIPKRFSELIMRA